MKTQNSASSAAPAKKEYPAVKALIAAIAVLAGIAAIVTLVFIDAPLALSTKNIAIGLDEHSGVKLLEQKGVEVDVMYNYSGDYPDGIIFEQHVVSRMPLRVVVVVSKWKESTTQPDTTDPATTAPPTTAPPTTAPAITESAATTSAATTSAPTTAAATAPAPVTYSIFTYFDPSAAYCRPDPPYAAAGERVFVECVPLWDCYIKAVEIFTARGENIGFEYVDGGISFIMPASDVDITVHAAANAPEITPDSGLYADACAFVTSTLTDGRDITVTYDFYMPVDGYASLIYSTNSDMDPHYSAEAGWFEAGTHGSASVTLTQANALWICPQLYYKTDEHSYRVFYTGTQIFVEQPR